MMLRDLEQREAADAIEAAAIHCLEQGPTTPDLGGTATTDQIGEAIVSLIARGNA
jgi:isocitrate/isopropylmalate dehydrogenase